MKAGGHVKKLQKWACGIPYSATLHFVSLFIWIISFQQKKTLIVQMVGRRPQAILVCVPSDIFFTMHNNCAVIEILGSFEGWNYSLVAQHCRWLEF